MPTLETPDELSDFLADQLGVYGAHDELCTVKRQCRVCYVSDMTDRIRAAVKNERMLNDMAVISMMEPMVPHCHWCETRHTGERKGPDGRYCPGPLLAPYASLVSPPSIPEEPPGPTAEELERQRAATRAKYMSGGQCTCAYFNGTHYGDCPVAARIL